MSSLQMMAHHWERRAVGLVVASMLILPALSACTVMGGADAGSAIPEVMIEATDAGYMIPAEVPSGVVALKLVGEAEGFPARLNEGVTLEQANEALSQPSPFAALGLMSLLGGSSTTTDDRLILDLKPGQHAFLAFEEGGPPSIHPFMAGEPGGATAPTADVIVDLVDFNFAVPAEISTGPKVWQISNKGEQWHQMSILKLNEGVTVDDLVAMMSAEAPPEGEPPYEEIASWSPSSPGETGWVTWDLPPGEYTVFCALPDIAGEMMPHAAKGMVANLTVTE